MHALESHILQTIDKQDKLLKDHPRAQQKVSTFRTTIEGHINAREARLEALGGSPTHPVKEAGQAACPFLGHRQRAGRKASTRTGVAPVGPQLVDARPEACQGQTHRRCGGRAPRRARPGGVGGLNRHIETAQGLAPVTRAVKAGLGAQFLPH